MSYEPVPPAPLTPQDVVDFYFDFELYHAIEKNLQCILLLALQRACGLISGSFFFHQVLAAAWRNNFPQEHAVLLAEHVYEVLRKGLISPSSGVAQPAGMHSQDDPE